MSYTKREWATGNVVGAVDLNRIENGIEDAGSTGGGALVIRVASVDGETTYYDKTWQEVSDAYDAGLPVYVQDEGIRAYLIACDSAPYLCRFQMITGFNDFNAPSANDYLYYTRTIPDVQ